MLSGISSTADACSCCHGCLHCSVAVKSNIWEPSVTTVMRQGGSMQAAGGHLSSSQHCFARLSADDDLSASCDSAPR